MSAGRTRAIHLPKLAWPLAIVVTATIVALRRPDAFRHAQFWAEDGEVWFADAYNRGWSALVAPYSGYLVTVPRLVAAVFTPLGPRWAPLAFNAVGLGVQIAPALFLVSSRLDRIVPDLRVRAVLAGIYLLLPSFELQVTLTDALWHLAVLAALVAIATPASKWYWRLFDAVTVSLCALTGPLGFPLIIILLFQWWLTRSSWLFLLVLLCALGDVAQVYAIAQGGRQEVGGLGASPQLLALLLADRVFLAGTFGQDTQPAVYISQGPQATGVALLVVLLAGAIIGAAMWRGPRALRAFTLFAFMVLAAGLAAPLASATCCVPQWSLLAMPGDGTRYFFIAELAWMACLVWAITRISLVGLRALLIVVLAATFASGLVRVWRYPAFLDLHPERYEAQLKNQPPGATFIEPLNPDGWRITLHVK